MTAGRPDAPSAAFARLADDWGVPFIPPAPLDQPRRQGLTPMERILGARQINREVGRAGYERCGPFWLRRGRRR
jgi:hypothetical protein